MRIETTKAAAAATVLAKLAEGKLSGAKYIRVASGLPLGRAYDDKGGNVEKFRPAGSRCGIGWLMSEEQAFSIEAHTMPGFSDYPLAAKLISAGVLVTDDDEWFRTLQQYVDAWGGEDMDHNAGRRRKRIVDHCNAALAEATPSPGYDIGNRRSDPVYA